MAGSGKNVLIVDDDPDDVETICRLLRRIDGTMNIDTAATITEAAVLMEGAPYALIVADHHLLPEIGTTLLATARVQQPDARRILMTGHPRIEIIQDALTRGRVHGIFRKDHEEEALRVLRANL